jgi:transglutaminase-like putative cysteine protease
VSSRAAKPPPTLVIEGPSRLLVIASDVVAAICVTLFATDLLRSGVPRATILLMSAWAALPRLVAEWIERPRSLFSSSGALVRARALAIMGVLLPLTATRYALASMPAVGARSSFEMVLVVGCWAAGFALRDPLTYRVYEPLCAITLVAGLLNDCARPLVLVPTAFLALAFSAALRHQLGRAAVSRRVRRVGIRNAAVAALAIGILVAGLFATSRAGLQSIVVPRASISGSGDDRFDDPPVLEPPEDPGGFSGGEGTPDWATAPHGAGHSGSLGLGPRRIVSSGPGEVVVHVLPAGQSEPPTSDTLWRARTFLRFDPNREEWTDQGLTFWTRAPMRGATMLRNPPAIGREPTSWTVEVIAEDLDALLVPYFTSEVWFEARRGDDVDLRVNADGDVSAAGGELARGRRHRVRVRPFDAVHPAIGDVEIGVAPSDDYLETPRATTKLGAHVRNLARQVLDRDATLAEKLRNLEAHFTGTYKYSIDPRRGRLPVNLTDFMTVLRTGDCRHIASAAVLVLRASGVPARLAGGYAGVGPPDEGPGWIVRQSWAHVWVEVLTKAGWVPVDPTRWVAPSLGRTAQANAEPTPEPDRRRKIGGPPDEPEPVRPKDRFNPIDNPTLLIVVTSIAGLFVVLMIVRSWRQRPEKPPEAEEDEEREPVPAAVPAPTRSFSPRTPAEHLLADYARMQDDLSLSGQERQSHETPREHAKRVSVGPGEPSAPAFGSLVPLVDDGLYGQADLTEGDLATGRGAIHAIKKALR